MGYWGWRRFVTVFVSVLMVGCSITSQSAPTIPPTSLPPVTLIARDLFLATPSAVPAAPQETPAAVSNTLVYTIQPGDTLLAIAAQFGVDLQTLQAANGDLDPLALPIGAALRIPNPHFNEAGIPILPTATPVTLVLLSPACHPTATGSILCLGQVINTHAESVTRVNISVRLLRQDGSLLAEGDSAVEQAFIPAGGTAPYRIWLQADWGEYASAVVSLSSAETPQPDAHFVTLDVQSQQAQGANGEYVVSALLHNPDMQAVHLTRAVLTVKDASGQVIAYRVVPMDAQLAPDTTLPIQISVMAAAVTYMLYVEAERSP